MTREEIEQIINADKIGDINLLEWLKMVLAKINEWRSKL